MKNLSIAVVLFAVSLVGCSDSVDIKELMEKAPCGATVLVEHEDLKITITKSCAPKEEADKAKPEPKPVAQKEPTPATK